MFWRMMAGDYIKILQAKVSLESCPACKVEPFVPFLRAQVRAGVLRHRFEDIKAAIAKKLPRVFAMICSSCKEIVAYEDLEGNVTLRRKYKAK